MADVASAIYGAGLMVAIAILLAGFLIYIGISGRRNG